MKIAYFEKEENSSEYLLRFSSEENYIQKKKALKLIEDFDPSISVLEGDVLVVDEQPFLIKKEKEGWHFKKICADENKALKKALKTHWAAFISIYGDAMKIEYVPEKNFLQTVFARAPSVNLSPGRRPGTEKHVILYDTQSKDVQNDFASLLLETEVRGEALITCFKDGFPAPMSQKDIEAYLV